MAVSNELFLVSCINHSTSGKINFESVATECGIPTKGAAAKRFGRLKEKLDMTLLKSTAGDAGDAEGPGDADDEESPKKKKAPAKKDAPTKKAGAAKKRKLTVETDTADVDIKKEERGDEEGDA